MTFEDIISKLPQPYYRDDAVAIYHADCRSILPLIPDKSIDLVLTDPPYNLGYHYLSYNDKLTDLEYADLLKTTITMPAVIIHYPENMFEVASTLGQKPEKCVAWVYNALTPRKWRMIAWFGISPDFSRITQPYKNLNDKRIRAELERGKDGCALYDWWQDEQVKNVSSEKTDHPCQIPANIMQYIIGITPSQIILDPFLGSGTTAYCAKKLGRKCIGIEIEEKYCFIAAKRCSQSVMKLEL